MLYLTVKKNYLEVEMLSQKARKAHTENLHFFPFHLYTNTAPPLTLDIGNQFIITPRNSYSGYQT